MKFFTTYQKFNVVVIDDYRNHNLLKEDYLDYLENHPDIQEKRTHVQATMTHWNLEKVTKQFKLLEYFAYNVIREAFCPFEHPEYVNMQIISFWGNIYRRGDYTRVHDHNPAKYSFVYFLKSKPNFSPLYLGSQSNSKDELLSIEPLEGRFVAFPGCIDHSVPVHNHDETRITLSGNFY